MAPRYRAKRVTILCVIPDCNGELTLEVSGWHSPAHGFDPPESPDVDLVGGTCSHATDPGFYETCVDVLYDVVMEEMEERDDH